MLSDYTVKKASVDDVGEMSGLLQMLFALESEFVPESEKQKEGIRMILEDPSVGQIFVLKKESSGIICGMVSLLFTISTALGGPAAMLEDMVIRPEYRHRGLGSLLISEALRYGKKKGMLRISLLTDDTNIAAASFYWKNGFKESNMMLMRMIL
jgi:ribosomal protein S18 acetylase RimI-like enzyme